MRLAPECEQSRKGRPGERWCEVSKLAGWNSLVGSVSFVILFVGLYGVRLGLLWVAILLIAVTGPILLLKYQKKDAKGRPLLKVERRHGVIGDLGFRSSRVGAKFAAGLSAGVSILLNLTTMEGWWPSIGVSTFLQDVAISASLIVSVICLFAYVSRRWPDE